MISVSGDEELLEALCHVSDGVFHVYVELGCSPSTNSVDHVPAHHLVGTLSSLLAGFTHTHCAGGLHGAGTRSAEQRVDDRSNSGQEQDSGKDESDKTRQKERQDIRQLIVDAANALLEPLG